MHSISRDNYNQQQNYTKISNHNSHYIQHQSHQQQQQQINPQKSAIGERKKLKVQFIPNSSNAQPNTCNLQINPKTWPNLEVNDILEISAITQSSVQSCQQSSNQHNSINRTSSLYLTSSSLNSKDWPSLTDEENSPILLQVTKASLNKDIPLNSIRIDFIATSAPFSFKNLADVNVTVVDKQKVVLDLVELLFKEQYFNGNDMLRIKKHMVNTCVYLKKNIEFSGMKCSVREMWVPNGDIVTCGYISEKTRLVFRAQSAMCTIYIQMSREMWEFDTNGEMQHEKAVNFLGELFTNWKNQACSHDVTITLFSRIFYEARDIDEFPSIGTISRQIQDNKSENKDGKSRFYEDYYRVIYQNERFEDWTPTLVILKRLIKEYRDYILNYHRRHFGTTLNMPPSSLSSAADGNFLETLILSSNVFERHFIDRPFDRTGMMSLVITPGNGLFNVSRKLCKITKDRVIDNAIGSDLVCLGEQPLHSVPLFKYGNSDNYDVPHWINLSFYKSSETVRFCNFKFVPSSKIKIKVKLSKIQDSKSILPDYCPDREAYQKSLEDTDNMFEQLPSRSSHSDSVVFQFKKTASRVNTSTNLAQFTNSNNSNQAGINQGRNLRRTSNQTNSQQLGSSLNEQNTSISGIKRSGHSTSSGFDEIQSISSNTATAMNNTNQQQDDAEFDDSDDELDMDDNDTSTVSLVDVCGSSTSIFKRPSATSKVNPFAPSSFKPRMSFERRRWAHTFPLRSDGTPIFQHWTTVQGQSDPILSPISSSLSNNNVMSDNEAKNVSPDSNKTLIRGLTKINELSSTRYSSSKPNTTTSNTKTTVNFNWETTQKNETKAFMRPGVAWKSLTTPACLPLTTDFFPTCKVWEDKFAAFGDYSLILDDIRDQYGYSRYVYAEIKMEQVFYELVGHRLAMGFQMVVPKDTFTYNNSNTISGVAGNNSNFMCDLNSSSLILKSLVNKSSVHGYYKLSLGRIYHELFYIVDSSTKMDYIKVQIYMPKKKVLDVDRKYCYRFQVPDSKTYDASYIKMTRTNNEGIKWNHIDSYICIQGNGTLTPSELKKCWRQRIYLIPIMYVNKTLQQQVAAATGNSANSTPVAGSYNQAAAGNVQCDKLKESQTATSQNSPKWNNNNSNFSSLEHQPFSATNPQTPDSNSSIFIYNIQTAGIIPASMLEDQIVPVYCDIYKRKSVEECKFFRDYYFIKFMEALNKLNRADDRRCYSKATIAYSEIACNQTVEQTTAISVISSQLQSISNINSNISNINPINLNTLNTPNLKNIHANSTVYKNLASPKVDLYPKVARFVKLDESGKSKDQILDNKEYVKLRDEIVAYLQKEYVDYMMSSDGVPFYEDNKKNKNDIPLNCFLSAESIWWCIDHIVDIEFESDGIVFMQILCDFGLVRHISNQQKIFIHGFNLYYLISDQNRDHYLYTKDYCEVGFCDLDFKPSSGPIKTEYDPRSLVSVNNLLPDNKKSLPVAANELYKAYTDIFGNLSNTKFVSTSPDSILKLVNVDVDVLRKSNRVEWASAVYRSHYHQLCAFELEIQWEMATGQLLSELMSHWTKQATRYNYHIVAAPIDPFASPIDEFADPLRGPIIIKLNFGCLIQNEKVLFENYIDKVYQLKYDKFDNEKGDFKAAAKISGGSEEAATFSVIDKLVENNPEFMEFLFKKWEKNLNSRENVVREIVERKIDEDGDFIEQEFQEFIEHKRIFRLQYFQEAILEKFGFVRNAACVKMSNSDEDPTFFIHSSGGMFVNLPNYYTNYYTSRSRHTSSNSNSSVTTTTPNKSIKPMLKQNIMSRVVLCNPSIDSNECQLNSEKSNLSNSQSNKSRINESEESTNFSKCSSSINSSQARERSNTKSQQVQFIKLNEINYLNTENMGIDSSDYKTKTDDDMKSDLLFKPKINDLRISAKTNEKFDLIQQQQREQMLLQSTTPTQMSHLEQHMIRQQNIMGNDQADILTSGSESLTQAVKKIPFYLEPDTYIGFSWSWNFMLGKRWRSQYTGDEAFQDNMLADFKVFCSNRDGRLLKFFNESKDFLN